MFAEDDPRLGQLLDGIIRLAAGELHSRIEVSPARDELDAIIMGTNLLAEDLEIIYQELEQRVESRTQLLHQAHEEMRTMALTDSLTGLANRSAFVAALAQAQADAAARDDSLPPAVVLLDLDAFKSINDTRGHAAGDRVLAMVGDRIRRAVRETDLVARLGGDEFAVLMPATSATRAAGVGTRILQSLNDPIELDNDSIHCGASMGLRIGEPGETAEQLMVEADIAMYASKREGRSKLKIFEPSMLHARQLRSQLAEDLRGAIADSELVLFYQPIVELSSGRVEGVEALVRWNHPERGIVMPDEFLPIAEDAGLMSLLGIWVLRTAVEQLRHWREDGIAPPEMSMRVNIAATDLQRLEFIEEVRDILTRADLSPDLLVLELTEQAIIMGNELDRYSLNSLRKLGVGLEIDDFGTGYSSISYLRRLPVDRVKVDRSILMELGTDPDQPALIAAVLQLIRACGLEAVWEGVETAEQAEYLRSIGCISAQGYYYSRPLAALDMARLLQDEHVPWHHSAGSHPA